MKGFVLTLEVAISAAIIGVILVSIFSIRAVNAFPELEAKRLATDIVAVLDYIDVLDTYDKNKIEGNLSQLLPSNLNMSMIIRRFNSTSFVSQLQINANITDNYMAGKWWFTAVKPAQYFYTVDYRVKFK